MTVERRPVSGRNKKIEDMVWRSRIADTLGVAPSSALFRDFKKAFTDTTHGAGKNAFYNKYISKSDSRRLQVERQQQLDQTAEALYDLHPYYASYGLFAPNYIEALKMQRLAQPTEFHTSLLVGALTQDTIKEYSASVRQVYPAAKTAVIDIEGEMTPAAAPAKFVYADGTALPFADESFNSIHGNNLLPYLQVGGREETMESRRRKFYEQAHRTLQPKGMLVMVDSTYYMRTQELVEAGFQTVQRYPAMKFTSRREMERALHFGMSNATHTFEEAEHVDFVIAVK